jgi:hypothetical protein
MRSLRIIQPSHLSKVLRVTSEKKASFATKRVKSSLDFRIPVKRGEVRVAVRGVYATTAKQPLLVEGLRAVTVVAVDP